MISKESRQRIRELKRKSKEEGLTKEEGYELEMLYGFTRSIKEDGDSVPYIALAVLVGVGLFLACCMHWFCDVL